MAEEIAQVCGLSLDAARTLHDAAGGDVTTALQMHFDQMDEDGDEQEPASAAPAASESSSRPVQTHASTRRAPAAKSSSSSSRPRKVGIASLRDYADDDNDDDEEENYYAGGKSSGQMVQGNPGRDKDGRKAVANIFKKAREQGAMSDEQYAEQEAQAQAKRKWGRGNRLGDPSEAAPEEAAKTAEPSAESEEEKEITRVIRFWQNGFSVDDGPLRTRDDPNSVEFINSISRGEVPMELRTPRLDEFQNLAGRRVVVHVQCEDNLDKDYQPPKKVFKAFGGGGNTLGSPVPEVRGSGQVGSGPKLSAVPPATQVNAGAKAVAVDDTRPTTKLQIRLHNGTRMIMNFNHDHTVGDLRNVMRSALTDGPMNFEIRQTMPPRVYEDDALTLEAAGLLKACVIQRPIKD